MKALSSSFRFPQLVFLLLMPVFWTSVFAQDAGSAEPDSTQAQTVDMADISIRSSETILTAKQIDSRLIEDTVIQRLKIDSDSLISEIDSLLQMDNKKEIRVLTARALDNNLIFWNQKLNTANDEKSNVTSVLHDLDDNKYQLSKESSLWEKTSASVEGEEFAKVVNERIDEVMGTLDTVIEKISEKGNIVLEVFDGINKIEIRIETRLEVIENEMLRKQQQIFETNQRSLFSINYSNKENWSISPSIARFYREDVKNLREYLVAHAGSVVFQIILLALLIALFLNLSKAKIRVGKGDATFYKKRFKVILSRPISAALVVSLFASVIIYPDSPLIFRDIMRFFVIFPIVLILIGVMHRRYHLYVYILGIVILLQLVYINLPVDNIISRFILLFISLLEAFAILHFIRNYKHRPYKKTGFSKVILILCYIHLALAVGGFVGDVIGKVMLAEIFLFSVAGNALVGTIIGLSLITVNGLLVLFIDSNYTDKVRVIKLNSMLIIQNVTRIMNIAAVVLFLYYILKIAGWEVTVINSVTEWFSKDRMIGSMEFSWSSILLFFLVIWLSILISKMVRAILEKDVLNKMKLKSGVPHTIALMVRYALVTVGIFLAVTAAGIDFGDFAIIFGAFGVGIGFGLQNIFNNLVSGFILLFERPIKINDTIEVGTLMGNVRSIGIRASNVRTFDGAEIIVPNGNLISNEVVNWTLSDQTRRIEVIVGVSYSSDPHQVYDVLLKVLKDHKDIVKDPEPNVFFKELGDSSLNFRLLCWTPQFDQWIRIKSEIIFDVFDALKAANIEIPFPQHDLHLRSIEPGIELKKL